MIAVIDYGVGNLFSLRSSLSYIGAEAEVTGDAAVIAKADRIILPGVGAFGDAALKLAVSGLDKIVKSEAESGKPLLGICLGMQLLFERGYEFGEHIGLGLIKGSVKPIAPLVGGLKVPHIGWNKLIYPENKQVSRLFREIGNEPYVYFVHSYAATDCDKSVSSFTEYGTLLTASVERDNVFGTQFHPEKSGETGLSILREFCRV